MTPLVPFDYSGRQVRTVQVDGEPWFVAADVCAILGLSNPSTAVSRLAADDLSTTEVIDSMGRPQVVRTVNESGLYDLILDSRRSEARAFRRWVTSEVLPAIRKTGSYGVVQFDPRNLDHVAELANVAAKQAHELEAAKPKVEAFDTYMDADNALGMGAVANQLGIGRNTMMRKLREAGVLQKDNRPYQRYAHHFKVVATSYEAQNSTRATHTTYVRPSGVELIRKVLSGGKGLLSIPGGAA